MNLTSGKRGTVHGEILSTDKKIISRLSAAGSKKTPLCYSKVKSFFDVVDVTC